MARTAPLAKVTVAASAVRLVAAGLLGFAAVVGTALVVARADAPPGARAPLDTRDAPANDWSALTDAQSVEFDKRIETVKDGTACVRERVCREVCQNATRVVRGQPCASGSSVQCIISKPTCSAVPDDQQPRPAVTITSRPIPAGDGLAPDSLPEGFEADDSCCLSGCKPLTVCKITPEGDGSRLTCVVQVWCDLYADDARKRIETDGEV